MRTVTERRGRSSVTAVVGLLCLLRSFKFLPLVRTLLHTLPFDLDSRAPNKAVRTLPLMESPHPLIPRPCGERFPLFFVKQAVFPCLNPNLGARFYRSFAKWKEPQRAAAGGALLSASVVRARARKTRWCVFAW